jgi:cellulose 1,4-beta-cellobiosidase
MCDPNYVSVSSGKPTAALPNAPAAGHWFHEQFSMLVKNAYPLLKEETFTSTEAAALR